MVSPIGRWNSFSRRGQIISLLDKYFCRQCQFRADGSSVFQKIMGYFPSDQ